MSDDKKIEKVFEAFEQVLVQNLVVLSTWCWEHEIQFDEFLKRTSEILMAQVCYLIEFGNRFPEARKIDASKCNYFQ